MPEETTRKRWQVWALLPAQSNVHMEAWRPVSMKYRERRTAERVASQLWLNVEVMEVEEEKFEDDS